MEGNDSDEDTVEFSIEIVESSSSISIASNGSLIEEESAKINEIDASITQEKPPVEDVKIIQAVEVEFKIDQPEPEIVTEAYQPDEPNNSSETHQTAQEIEPLNTESEIFEIVIPDEDCKTNQIDDRIEDSADNQASEEEVFETPSEDPPEANQHNDLESTRLDSTLVGGGEGEGHAPVAPPVSIPEADIEIIEPPVEVEIKTEAVRREPVVEPLVALDYILTVDSFQFGSIIQTPEIELVELSVLTTGELENIPTNKEEQPDEQITDIELEASQIVAATDQVNDSGVSADLEPESLYESEKNEIDADLHDARLEDSSSPLVPEIAIDAPEISIAERPFASPVNKFIDEDLEREFDEEPEFERRDVELKRNCDPRQEYELGEELGRGRFGTVFKCTEQVTGRSLAAKFIHMRRKEDREDVEREIFIMSKLQHKRLLQLYDAFDDGKSQMCLITELVDGGELFERIIDDDFDLTEKKAAIFMRQICEGVEYMHGQRIVHLDMKPENILCLSRTGNRIKLIDFGLARQLNSKEPLRVMFGTPDFAAPEVLAYDVVTLATDMWSVGVICYVLLSGLSPFMGDNDMETMANVLRATYDFDDDSFDPISDLAKDFIAKLLVKDPSERLRPSECLKHPWLQRGGNQLDASLKERRKSSVATMISGMDANRLAALAAAAAAQVAAEHPDQLIPMDHEESNLYNEADEEESPGSVSLSKRNLKRYVVRRRWHKTVHAIMALGRMGANLRLKLGGGLGGIGASLNNSADSGTDNGSSSGGRN